MNKNIMSIPMAGNRNECPATLDLTERAVLSLNWLLKIDTKVKVKENSGWWAIWGYGDVTARMVEAIILVRQLIGRKNLFPQEKRLRRFLFSLFNNGLVYIERSKYTPRRADMFSQGRTLRALVTLYMENPGDEMAKRIEEMVSALKRIARDEKDYSYFPAFNWDGRCWSDTDLSGTERMKAAPYKTYFGDLSGQPIFPLVRYYELTKNDFCLQLAERMARGIMNPQRTMFNQDGSFTYQTHHRTSTVVGVLYLGMVTGNDDYVRWAKRIADWILERSSPFGYVGENIHVDTGAETCAIVDVMMLAILLARHGYDKYWNIVERYVRNHLIESQFPEEGGFAGHSYPNDLYGWEVEYFKRRGLKIKKNPEGGCGCCSPHGAKGLFFAWKNIIWKKGEEVYINLALNRRSEWVEVISYRPYLGKLEVVIHDAPVLYIRIPDWVRKDKVMVKVNSSSRDIIWVGDYVRLDGLRKGQRVIIEYPLRVETEKMDIYGKEYFVRWRGDTVVQILPPGPHAPLYQRKDMDSCNFPLKKGEACRSMETSIEW